MAAGDVENLSPRGVGSFLTHRREPRINVRSLCFPPGPPFPFTTRNRMDTRDDPSLGRVMLLVLVFAALGTPMFLYLWETVNALLTGHVDGLRLLISLPVLAMFAALLAVLRRALAGLDGTGPRAVPTHPPPSRR
jgi:hypothetical protein